MDDLMIEPVQRQLDAYNARDIERFMQCWAEDCEYYAFPAELLAQGAAAVRARHLERFQEPNLHGALIRRIVAAGLVIDHETVTRTFAEGPGEVDVVAIYQVERGLIAKAWFRMGPPRLHAGPSIRTAVPADVDAIRALVRDAYAKWVPLIGREPRPMTADYDRAVREHRIDLVHIDGTLAALIELIAEPGHLLIENVAVSPAFQKRGLGRTLLAHAEAVAVSMRYELVRLYTNQAFAENIQLYRALGYAIDREEPFLNGIAVHMSKPVRG